MSVPTLALVGLRGYGGVHLGVLRRRHAAGELRLVGAVDPAGPVPELPEGVPCVDTLPELLATVVPDVTVIASPIPTHLPFARLALEAGSDVYLEKPPVAGLDEYDDLVEVVRRSGRSLQVGFQNLGSPAVPRVQELVAGGAVGEVEQVSGLGLWNRRPSYYARAAWAGRRMLDGRRTADGVVTNPLAHAANTALRLAGIQRRDQIAGVDTELYRVHDIDCDDTAWVRVQPVEGPPVCLAFTLAAGEQQEPTVSVRGTTGTVSLAYTADRIEVARGQQVEQEQHGREDLVVDLIRHHQDPGHPLLSSLAATEAFMVVLEAVQRAPVTPVDPAHVAWSDEEDPSPHLADVEEWCARALAHGGGFAAAGAPWASPEAVTRWRPSQPLAAVELDGAVVAVEGDGGDVAAENGPRPFLHPLRTRRGVRVTDDHPFDHVWHHGLSVALQHVAGTNFWGGRTYLPEGGYQWRDDHGRIVHRGFTERTADSWTEELEWIARSGDPVLSERRRLRWWSADPRAWAFELEFTLTPSGTDAVELGSPGSHGREGGGYGGLTWRLPRSTDVHLRTAAATGEEAVHGSVAPWVAWSGTVEGGDVTLALAGADETTAADPWFVRVRDYPALGSSLAWSSPAVTSREQPLTRRFTALVADGRLDDDEVVGLLTPPA
ncbi:DUF6807 family protein [Auraticoccus cholistanensis]|nr:DUF6807 family protein [Auraticoccus cholistanensis]